MKFRELHIDSGQSWWLWRYDLVAAVFGQGDATYMDVPAPRFREAGWQDGYMAIGQAIVAALFVEDP